MPTRGAREVSDPVAIPTESESASLGSTGEDPREAGFPGVRARLFLLGFLTLFLELVLIRFLAGNVWNLGYFPNLVLLAVFVGMGLGFVFHQKASPAASRSLFQGAAFVLALLVAFVDFAHPVVPGFGRFAGEVGGELFFTSAASESTRASFLLFVLWFGTVVVVFGLVSQRTAKLFRQFPPLTSYTLDIAGSCAGILVFMAVSWLELPAFLWFALLVPFFLLASPSAPGGRRWLALLPLAAASLLAWHADSTFMAEPGNRAERLVRWSPYQKIENIRAGAGWAIYVNGIVHQSMEPIENIRNGFYQVPYKVRSERQDVAPYKSVLVIGAGSGNDVAAALANGAEHIDAVEIDPGIAALGRRFHPARPYDDARVVLTIDDGRAFMTRTPRRYDLVIFALTDSLVKVSSMSQLRLENYLFTVESIRRASRLLAPDGDLLFYNFYRKPWLVVKLAEMIREATGKYPRRVFESGGFLMMMAGSMGEPSPPPPKDTARIEPPTDDWPFLYLFSRGVPGIYLRAMAGVGVSLCGLMLVLHLRQRRRHESLGGLEGLATKLAFVFMGIAFLLLETKSVVQFSLLFGTTWLNNSLVFLAVLLLVLAANHAATRLAGDGAARWVAYALLMGSCLATLVYPLGRLLSIESTALRFVAASLMTFSPIFFANLIFSLAFRGQSLPEHIFGWNLIGATLGGLAEYASMAVGYNALALVVAACYTLVVILLAVARRARSGAPVPG